MLPSSKWRRQHVASAAVSVFLLWSLPASASLVSIAADGVDPGLEPPRNFSALETAVVVGNQDPGAPERAIGNLWAAQFGQTVYVEPETGSLIAPASARGDPVRRETLRQVVRTIATMHSFQQRQWHGAQR